MTELEDLFNGPASMSREDAFSHGQLHVPISHGHPEGKGGGMDEKVLLLTPASALALTTSPHPNLYPFT